MRFLALLTLLAAGCYDDPVRINPYERTTPGEEVDRRWRAVPPPPGCGDGRLDPGEACDDGNRIDSDGCSNACEQPPPRPQLRAIPVVDAVAGSRRFGRSADGAAQIAPFQPVRLSGRDSITPDGEPAAYEWSFSPARGAARPAGSAVAFDDSSKDRPRLVYSVRGEHRPGVDLNGHYAAALRVQAADGSWSGWSAVSFNAKPNRALWVELNWDVDEHDIDLHLIRNRRAEGAYGTDQDCFFSNCVPETVGNPVLHWGGRSIGDDPFLDVDDIDGLGPEVTSILAPEAGQVYIVGLHFYRQDGGLRGGQTTAAVKVFIDGEVVAEASRLMLDGDDWWEVFHITWGDEPQVQKVDTYADEQPGTSVP